MLNRQPENRHDPAWVIAFDNYEPADEGRREAVLALGNGVFVTRAATLDARKEPGHYPGTYRAACYDRVPNEIEGECDETESLVNLPNWLPLIFSIDSGSWLRLDEAALLDYFHGIDLRTGTMHRECLLSLAGGRRMLLRERRLVSMDQPHVAALRLEVTPLDWSGELDIRSILDGDVHNTNVPRFRDYESRHLTEPRTAAMPDGTALLHTRTIHSQIEVALAMRTTVNGDAAGAKILRPDERSIGHAYRAHAEARKTVVVEKTVALCTSLDAGSGDVAREAQDALRRAGDFPDLRRRHERRWADLWSRAAIEAEDARIAQSLRLHAFHILQTVSPRSAGIDTGIPARGWHGEAYHGHIFWDELFVLPFLDMRFPELAKVPLLYRYRRLGAARQAAREAGYRGAMYPWRSAGDGREVTPWHQKDLLTGQWMRDDTRLQRHIGSAIALNIWQYWLTTGDAAFLADYGAEMMLEIARFWASIAQPGEDGRFGIRGVIGPDEYHNAYPGSDRPGLDNNAYTNIMAVWTLCRALDVLEQLPEARREALRQQLGLRDEELALWDRISRRMFVPFHGDGILSQFAGFDRLAPFDPEMLPPRLSDERVDWALRAIGKSADDYQVTKQADALTLFHLLAEDEVIGLLARLGYAFDCDGIRRTAHYYLPRTTHRSSLSRVVYAGALARLEPELSWRLYREALTTDLNPMKGQSIAEGIHLGAMGGTLDILQRRYLGIAAVADGLRVVPALPAGLGRVRLGLHYRGSELEVETAGAAVRVRSRVCNRAVVTLVVDGETRLLAPGDETEVRSRFL